MTTKEVCETLKISHDTLRRLRDRGVLSPLPGNPVLLKSPLRFNRADVLALAGKSDPPKEK